MASAEELAAPLSYAEDSDRPTPWHRYISALARYRWLVLACVALGAGAGFVGARFVAPEYEAHATVWISTDEEHAGPQAGPIPGAGAPELHRLGRVSSKSSGDRLGRPSAPALSRRARARLRRSSRTSPSRTSYQPGGYRLKVAPTGDQYRSPRARKRPSWTAAGSETQSADALDSSGSPVHAAPARRKRRFRRLIVESRRLKASSRMSRRCSRTTRATCTSRSPAPPRPAQSGRSTCG